MLHRLTVRGFKSLRNVDVSLRRLVVVFGPNATGKSNLLEALVLLSRLVRERTLGEAFESGVRGYPNEAFTLGPGGLAAFHDQDSASLRLGVQVGTENVPSLQYVVEVGIRPKTGELSLQDELLQELKKDGHRKGQPIISKTEDGSRIRVRRREKQSHPFEEPPGFHYTLASNLQYSGNNYSKLDELRAEVRAWQAVYLDPREAMRRPEPPRDVESIGDRGQWLIPFLHRLQEEARHAASFRAIVRATRAVIPSIEDVRVDLVRSRGELELQVLQSGGWLSGRVVSEGTLRVLALCAMAANPFEHRLLAFEEPENGVHPRRIENITGVLISASKAPRQVIVTTHSPQVVGEVVRRVRSGDVDAGDVQLLAAYSGPEGSAFRSFDPAGPLFENQEVQQALQSQDDGDRLEAMLRRGWLDG